MNTTAYNFDPQALGRKYQEERDKRVRADGNDQYQEVTGDFAYFVEDPYIAQTLEREAIEEEVEVVVIGGGFGGHWNLEIGASCLPWEQNGSETSSSGCSVFSHKIKAISDLFDKLNENLHKTWTQHHNSIVQIAAKWVLRLYLTHLNRRLHLHCLIK